MLIGRRRAAGRSGRPSGTGDRPGGFGDRPARQSSCGEGVRLGGGAAAPAGRVPLGHDDAGVVGVRLGQPDRPAVAGGRGGEVTRLPDVHPGVAGAVNEMERDRLGRRGAGDVGDRAVPGRAHHRLPAEPARQADDRRGTPAAGRLRVERQRRGHPAAARPPGQHELAIAAGRQPGRLLAGQPASEIHRGEQLRPAAVGRIGFPVGNDHRDAPPGHLGGQRLEDIPLAGADAVPQQRQRSRTIPPRPVDIGQLPQPVANAPLDQNVTHASTIHHPSRLQRSPGRARARQTRCSGSLHGPRVLFLAVIIRVCLPRALESTRDRENISFDEDFSRRARIIYVKKKVFVIIGRTCPHAAPRAPTGTERANGTRP